ncbi:hypothetical protein PanWU01x14_364030 [Parasponia andersonii]|uniref:Transmembrane protein n=1 Tax=Parasponia andersonii TaxID=3476 RepID=A0A2P5A6G6_PARAD|nr:hypothetical protein PanWU01x14_364030 [Parasponia andersonii]
MEDNKLQADSEELKLINNKQEQRVRFHRTRAENFTIAFLVLQALQLTVITVRSSSTSLRSKEWLVHFIAILLTSVIFFIAFLDAVISFYWTQYELDINYMDLELKHKKIKEVKYNESAIKYCHAIQIDQGSSSSDDNYLHVRSPDPVKLFKRKGFIYVTVSVLIGSTITELYACHLLLGH